MAIRWVLATMVAGLVAAGPAGAAQETTPAPAAAPDHVDARWLPWLGCWELLQDRAPLPAPSGRPVADLIRRHTIRDTGFVGDVRVCLLPAASRTAVTMATLADGETAFEEALVADGQVYDIRERECTGWRRQDWSRDGLRLFTRAELECDGQPRRAVSGVTLITRDAEWIDVQAVEIGGREHVRVRRYARAHDRSPDDALLGEDLLARAATAASRAGTARLGVDEVVEAHANVSPAALEALLVETGSTFDLDGRTLIRLADAGVSGSVIDLMVALSFPDQFIVDRAGSRGGTAASSMGFRGAFDPWGAPAMLDPFWYPYYAAPFGYAYGWSRYDPYFQTGRPILLLPSGDAGSDTASGVAVEGRGYTRVRPRDDAGGTRAVTRDGSSRTGTRGTSADSGGSSGGTASPQGYSGGGSDGRSGSGSGRTARPRDP